MAVARPIPPVPPGPPTDPLAPTPAPGPEEKPSPGWKAWVAAGAVAAVLLFLTGPLALLPIPALGAIVLSATVAMVPIVGRADAKRLTVGALDPLDTFEFLPP